MRFRIGRRLFSPLGRGGLEACRRDEFMGFSPTLVLLTAVHFHMAGLVRALLPFWGGLESVGSIVMTAGVWALAVVGWRLSHNAGGLPRHLLRVGALAPFGSMLLAMQYGLGGWTFKWLDLQAAGLSSGMAREFSTRATQL